MILLIAQGSRNTEPLGQPHASCSASWTSIPPMERTAWQASAYLVPGCWAAWIEKRWLPKRSSWPISVERLIAHDCSRVHVRVVREWRRFAGDALDLLDINRAVLDVFDGHVPSYKTEGTASKALSSSMPPHR